jgi:hypothetical protein
MWLLFSREFALTSDGLTNGRKAFMKIKSLSLLRRIAWPLLAVVAFPIAVTGTTPPFTDANWISMGGLPGANGEVYATGIP